MQRTSHTAMRQSLPEVENLHTGVVDPDSGAIKARRRPVWPTLCTSPDLQKRGQLNHILQSAWPGLILQQLVVAHFVGQCLLQWVCILGLARETAALSDVILAVRRIAGMWHMGAEVLPVRLSAINIEAHHITARLHLGRPSQAPATWGLRGHGRLALTPSRADHFINQSHHLAQHTFLRKSIHPGIYIISF